MDDLPADLRSALPDGTIAIAEGWWAALPEEDRQKIIGLWDERLEVRFFSPQMDDGGHLDAWEKVPHVKGGQFARPDSDGREEWMLGYFEHLLQHPELMLAYEPIHRTFHIGCTRHAAARKCIADGRIPLGFVCPVATSECPYEQLRGAHLERRKV